MGVRGPDELVLFDTMTHTSTRSSGLGDHGADGILQFKKQHVCNTICDRLGLTGYFLERFNDDRVNDNVNTPVSAKNADEICIRRAVVDYESPSSSEFGSLSASNGASGTAKAAGKSPSFHPRSICRSIHSQCFLTQHGVSSTVKAHNVFRTITVKGAENDGEAVIKYKYDPSAAHDLVIGSDVLATMGPFSVFQLIANVQIDAPSSDGVLYQWNSIPLADILLTTTNELVKFKRLDMIINDFRQLAIKCKIEIPGFELLHLEMEQEYVSAGPSHAHGSGRMADVAAPHAWLRGISLPDYNLKHVPRTLRNNDVLESFFAMCDALTHYSWIAFHHERIFTDIQYVSPAASSAAGSTVPIIAYFRAHSVSGRETYGDGGQRNLDVTRRGHSCNAICNAMKFEPIV
ncbi:hypothetical protein EVG20_g10443 [Dentipellis fragilis]|uniref:Alpha-type protein kinase domain-containing protein n=1 Tax=Dentipellis fragilis TaxID=205917 RepID=A0A4Y9XSG4_9AGAM|nr:hypothetical protein EVG20_g10443 [Dentipellis fragilis]